MSNFTTEVRFICESLSGYTESVGYASVDEILNNAAPKVFDFNWDIFDENYRLVLEKKILKHYYTREISEETYGLWKLRLDARMNEIMPYYNELYKSSLLKFNPLYDVDYKTIEDENKNSDTKEVYDELNNVIENVNKNYKENETLDGSDTVKDYPVKYDKSIDDSGVSNENKNTKDNKNKTSSGLEFEENKTNNNSETESKNNNNSNERSVVKNSDTPQGGLSMDDISGDIYLTTAEIDELNKSDTQSGKNITKANNDNVKNSNYKNNDIENNVVEGVSNNSYKNKKNEKFDYEEPGENVTEYGKINDTKGEENLNKTKSYNEKGKVNKNIKDTNNYIMHVSGKKGMGSFSKLLLEFRETFLKIDLMVIEELADLFFGLWE